MCKQKIKTEGEKMTEKCSKENEINSLFKNQSENQKSLIKIETLLDSLIKYQISEQKEAIVSTRAELSSLNTRVTKLENLTFKIIASAAAGGVVGSFVFNLLKDKL
jgi:BMFP domain-containing protein YqiC